MRHFTYALALFASVAHADSPAPPPQRVVSCSSSGEVCAESDPRTNVTQIVSKLKTGTLWSIKGWHRWLFVAEDGKSVVVGYSGMNLVPADTDLQFEVFHFYNQGKLVRTVKLADLYSDRSQLIRTVSHLEWVSSVRVNRASQLIVELVSGSHVAFNMATGERQAQIRDGA